MACMTPTLLRPVIYVEYMSEDYCWGLHDIVALWVLNLPQVFFYF